MAYYFNDELKNEIINANDIADVVSEYVQLKKTGRNLLGLCPFHNEKTASFNVLPERQFYKCFGCGVGGNVVDFVMRIEHLDFQEAMLFLAERAHIKVEELSSNVPSASITDKEKVFNINTEAARFFNKTLKSYEIACNYVDGRGLSENVIRKFGLGFAPDSWNALLNHLKVLGFSEDDIYKAGLISKKESHYYDAFRNRIMFPIIDIRGRVVGFGGRVLDDSKPKYLNSPETPVFDKSRNFYGLNFAKADNHKTAVIVEGYMDVIALHQVGITNAIATLGTSFTEEHAKILKRYFDDIVLSFDSDDAGKKATERCISIINKIEGLKVRVLSQNQVKDPDEYIKKYGKDAFLALIDNAFSHIDYRISLIKEGLSLANVEDKIRFVSEAAQLFAEISSDIEREAYVKKVARESNISEDSIFSEIYKILGKKKRTYSTSPVLTEIDKKSVNSKAEIMLLSLLYGDKSLCDSVSNIIDSRFFVNKVYGEVFDLIKRYNDLSTAFDQLTDEQKDVAVEISVRDYHIIDKRLCAAELIERINDEKTRANLNAQPDGDDANLLKQIISKDKRCKKGIS